MANIHLYQSNYLTAARYDYDVVEKRIIYHILLRLKDSLFNKPDQLLFTHDMDILIPESQLKRVDQNDNYYRDYRKAVKSLREKSFSINQPDGWIETGFLLRGQYRKAIGLEITVSRDVLGFLYDLSSGFTKMDFAVAITLHSKYAQRFYEWCCRWRGIGKFSFTPNELRDSLELTQETKWLKQFVIDIAERRIKELYDEEVSDIYFTYTEDRKGRGRGGSVQKWNFQIHSRNQQKLVGAKGDDVRYIYGVFKEVYGNKPALINQLTDFVTKLDPIQIKSFTNRLEQIANEHKKKPLENPAGLIRHILKEDYGFGFEDSLAKDQPESNSNEAKSIASIVKIIKKSM